MRTAIIALVGVVIGGAINALTAYLMARQRERADRATEDRKRALEVKRAARLLDAELIWVGATAYSCIERKQKPLAVDTLPLSPTLREQCLATLAPDMSYDQWVSLNRALVSAETMMLFLKTSPPPGAPDLLPDELVEAIVLLQRGIQHGRDALDSLHRGT